MNQNKKDCCWICLGQVGENKGECQKGLEDGRQFLEATQMKLAQARAEERQRCIGILEGMKIHKGKDCGVLDCYRYNQALSELKKAIE